VGGDSSHSGIQKKSRGPRDGKGHFGAIRVRVCLDTGLNLCLFVWNLLSPLIDMADQHPAQSVKKSRGFLKHLKNMFRPGSQSNPQAGLTINPKEAAELRAKYTHFRILVIGRANAGKTTLLKRVCNTKEDPVYNKVRYHPRLKSCLILSYTDRSTRHRRYHLPHFSDQVVDPGAVARGP